MTEKPDLGPVIQMLRREYGFGGSAALTAAIAVLNLRIVYLIAEQGFQTNMKLGVLDTHKTMVYWFIVDGYVADYGGDERHPIVSP